MKISKLGKVAVVAAVSTALAIPTFTSATAANKFATATSASQVGGLAGLANECRKEGQLNVIALPHDWADYGSIIERFKSKYGVKVDEANPDAGSQEEIDTANRLKGTSRSPDVFDIGYPTAGTYPGTGIFSPYKVRTWNVNYLAQALSHSEITPAYTGLLTIGYDASLGNITKLDDLLKPVFKGKVAINGDPLVSTTALNAIFMVNLALGGTFDDVAPAVAWFKKLNSVGNFINVKPSVATYASGQTPVVMDNMYNQVTIQKKMKDIGKVWKVFTPSVLGSTYNIAISAWAPHPACARLWTEFIASEEVAAIYASAGATPAIWPYLVKTRRAPAAGIAVVGKTKVSAPQSTTAQQTKAPEYLKANWSAAVG